MWRGEEVRWRHPTCPRWGWFHHKPSWFKRQVFHAMIQRLSKLWNFPWGAGWFKTSYCRHHFPKWLFVMMMHFSHFICNNFLCALHFKWTVVVTFGLFYYITCCKSETFLAIFNKCKKECFSFISLGLDGINICFTGCTVFICGKSASHVFNN